MYNFMNDTAGPIIVNAVVLAIMVGSFLLFVAVLRSAAIALWG